MTDDYAAIASKEVLARQRSRRLGLVAGIILGVCLLASIASNIVVIVDKINSGETTNQLLARQTEQISRQTEQIEQLTSELQAARALLESSNAVQRAREACVKTFTGAIAVALSEAFADLSDLVVTIATFAPGPDRAEEIGGKVADLDESVKAYRAVVQQRNEWDAGGSVLPCPIEPGS